MSIALRLSVAALAFQLHVSPGAAQIGESGFDPLRAFQPPPILSEGQKRRILRPFVVTASDCIARTALLQPDIIEAYRSLNLQPAIAAAWRPCGSELRQVAAEHDRLHGSGTGLAFLQGPYSDDLPRAVRTRIKDEVERRIIAADAAEAERKADQARREARHIEAVAQAENVANAARERVYACTDAELRKLVSSAETADNLATAAMTLCRREVTEAVDTRVEVGNIKSGYTPAETELRPIRENLRRSVRESVLTSAVQVKAAANNSAPAQTVGPKPPTSSPSGPVVASTVPAAPLSAPARPKVSAALGECFQLTNTAQKGKLINREALLRAMLELCRPEIELAARSAYLADSSSITLEQRREATLTDASQAASDMIDGAGL